MENKNNKYIFHIYDNHKSHGYIYSSDDRLYHPTDRQSIRKYIPRNVSYQEFPNSDLRPIMDIAHDILPIDDKILIPSSGVTYERSTRHHFTYKLESPVYNDKVSQYIKQLIPNIEEYNKLHKFLYSSLVSYTPDNYIIINGSDDAVSKLFSILLLLNPIVKRSRRAVYREYEINKTTLDEIQQARIVLCDVGKNTIRVALPPLKNTYTRPIQYHGVIYQDPNPCTINPRDESNVIHIQDVSENILITPGEVLGWILEANNIVIDKKI